MKKAKIMLVAIAAFAVVGAGLAFKAKMKNAGALYFTNTTTTFAPLANLRENATLVDESGLVKTTPGGFYATTTDVFPTASIIYTGQ